MGTEETNDTDAPAENATPGAGSNPATRAAAIAAVEAMRSGKAAPDGEAGEKPVQIESEDDIRKPPAEDGGDDEAGDEPEEPATPAAKKTITTPLKVPETQLTSQQEASLRVRKEAQRYREKARAELADAEKVKADLAENQRKIDARSAELDAKQRRIEDAEKLAKDDPDAFFARTGKTFDDVVREKLEAGKPDARITALEREREADRQELKRLRESIETKEKAAEDAEAKAKVDRAEQHRIAQAANAEKIFGDLVEADPKKYPALSRLAQRSKRSFLAHAYATYDTFKEEQGREPASMDELVLNAERILRDDPDEVGGRPAPAAPDDDEETDVIAPAPNKTQRRRRGGGGTAVVDMSNWTEEQRRKHAIREVNRMRATGTKPGDE